MEKIVDILMSLSDFNVGLQNHVMYTGIWIMLD